MSGRLPPRFWREARALIEAVARPAAVVRPLGRRWRRQQPPVLRLPGWRRGLATSASTSSPCAACHVSISPSETREICSSRSTPPSRVSTCPAWSTICPFCAATRQSSIAWATCTAGSRPTTRAAPFSEWAARIRGSMVAAVAPEPSSATSPCDSTDSRSSASMRNRSIIEKPLRSSLIARCSAMRQRPAARQGSRRSGPPTTGSPG